MEKGYATCPKPHNQHQDEELKLECLVSVFYSFCCVVLSRHTAKRRERGELKGSWHHLNCKK